MARREQCRKAAWPACSSSPLRMASLLMLATARCARARGIRHEQQKAVITKRLRRIERDATSLWSDLPRMKDIDPARSFASRPTPGIWLSFRRVERFLSSHGGPSQALRAQAAPRRPRARPEAQVARSATVNRTSCQHIKSLSVTGNDGRTNGREMCARVAFSTSLRSPHRDVSCGGNRLNACTSRSKHRFPALKVEIDVPPDLKVSGCRR